jgi:diguanylate cyclase (GGDEF)-like protein/PAS domain S-box-containing protein
VVFNRLFVTATSVAFGVTLYEVIKQTLIPNIAIWESHGLTILVATLFVTIAAYLMARHLQTVNNELEARISAEKWYRSIFEASSDGIFITDPKRGRFTEINEAGTAMFGCDRLELIGCDFEQHSTGVPPFTLQSALSWFEKARVSPQLFEWHCKAKDGHYFWVEISLRLLSIGDEKVEIAAFRDISERKHLEQGLNAHANTVTRLTTMAQRLQSCRSNDEIADAVSRFAPQILPGVPGALCVFSNSRNLLRVMSTWNEPVGLAADFAPSECWGLRRGQVHIVTDISDEVVCRHVSLDKIMGYSCRPLVAHDETLGLLYLEQVAKRAQSGTDAALASDDVDLLAENISLALGNQRMQEKLRDRSIRDPLSGLFNRRYLEEALEIEIARAARGTSSVSVVMADIDHFKQFNDQFGHEAGDLVITRVAETMRATVRQGDIVCRYGGEEFVILLHNSDLASACENAESVRQAIKSLNVIVGNRELGSVTMSFGVATFPLHAEDGKSLVNAADSAMYAAKHAGRDQVVVARAMANPCALDRAQSTSSARSETVA